MPAAYLIAQVDVKDPARYEAYKAGVSAVIAAYGGEYIVRGGAVETMEGEAPSGRVIVLKFPSMEQARAFYHSDEYADLLALRLEVTESRLFIVEGAE
jgi:uncharacterized protein (DUF1330 family)